MGLEFLSTSPKLIASFGELKNASAKAVKNSDESEPDRRSGKRSRAVLLLQKSTFQEQKPHPQNEQYDKNYSYSAFPSKKTFVVFQP